ncbi:hypothetical protein DICPUDRAFT_84657 [Dictyostelium purpureum]|uniref:DDT domain-containing protein n=1 Tax=Dictyostelium purpureum TaxID=5786 RepID=F1A3B8_DICPU|nr:uncharacterized protein DICPUDRAFT_84657 [Dictyostelium purpureum]EGC29312.1 hypothetical protein DICPUDRAFT_84657 [Dictyostelium purpureum]|eukprot:XP_003294160.1 hypothetical protein DICPUDRAFT_84657 [Dictyostelium purpureum]
MSILESKISTPNKSPPQQQKYTPEQDQDIVRSMWETPSIYQYLSFFKQPLGIKNVSSDDLEGLLLNPKNYPKLTGEIFIALLKDLLPITKQRTINFNNWEQFLKTELNKENNYFDIFDENPFLEGDQFSEISQVKDRVLLLKAVCDWSLAKSQTILAHVKNYLNEPDTLRNLPLGILNNQKEFYYYFGDYRLYRETVTNSNGRKKTKDQGREQNGKWEIVCSTSEEWDEIIEKYEPYSEEGDESDEKTLYINLKDVYPQVTAKLAASKRKKNSMFSSAQVSNPVNDSKHWRSSRLLAKDLRKKEQEDLMQIQQQQIQQLENDPFSRPRSTRARTNLYFNDEGVLNNPQENDEDMIGGGKSVENVRKRGRGSYEDKQSIQVHFSRSGRRVITDDYGRPRAYSSLTDDEKKYVDGFIEEEGDGEGGQEEEEYREQYREEGEEDESEEEEREEAKDIVNNNENNNKNNENDNNKSEKQKLQEQLQQLQQQVLKEQQQPHQEKPKETITPKEPMEESKSHQDEKMEMDNHSSDINSNTLDNEDTNNKNNSNNNSTNNINSSNNTFYIKKRSDSK